jgi:hypothetical protein
MVPNKKTIPCKTCGKDTLVEVVPDGFYDAPASFVITFTCSGSCEKAYAPMSAQKMHELTGLPLSGWMS